MSISNPKIKVWDTPVRVFHWLMVLSFAGAYLTAESERWRLVHVTLGYTMGGLLAFRLVWGLVGSRYALFGGFVRGPAAVMRYLRSLLGSAPEHHVGHNPAGSVAIVSMLVTTASMVGSGWAVYNDVGGNLMENLHELSGNFMLAVVAVHVLGVVVASKLHHENLLRSMVTGNKEGAPNQGIQQSWYSLALVILWATLYFWWTQLG
jgi:cytochrome b